MDNLIKENFYSDYDKVHRSRAALAGNLTSQCKKSQSLYDKALRTGTCHPKLIKENIQYVRICLQKLEYFCQICVESFSAEDKVSRPEAFAVSTNYLEKYEASAALAISQMESILKRAPASSLPSDPQAASSSQSVAASSASMSQQPDPAAALAEQIAGGSGGRENEGGGGGGGGGGNDDIGDGDAYRMRDVVERTFERDDADGGEHEWDYQTFGTPPESQSPLMRYRRRPVRNLFIFDDMQHSGGSTSDHPSDRGRQAASGPSVMLKPSSGAGPSTPMSSPGPWQPSPAMDISPVGGENLSLALMARSLSAQFDIRKLVPTAFDGTASKWQEWFVRWQAADQKMAECAMPFQQRFLLLRERVIGPPANYLSSLPLLESASYVQALEILRNLQVPQLSKLRDTVHKFLSIKKCNADFSSRSAMHGRIISFKHACQSLSASKSDILLCFEMFVIERALDPALLKQHVKYCERQRDSNNIVGFNVTFGSIVDNLYESMLMDLKLQNSASQPFQQKRVHFRTAPVHTVTAQGRMSRRDNHETATEQPRSGESSYAVVAGTPIRNVRRSKLTPTGRPPSRSASPGQAGPRHAAPRSRSPSGSRPPRSSSGTSPRRPSSRAKAPPPKCYICWDEQNKTNRFRHTWPAKCPLIWNSGPAAGPRIEWSQARAIASKYSLCHICLQKHSDMTLTHGRKCPSPEWLKCTKCGQRHHAIFCQNSSPRPAFQISQGGGDSDPTTDAHSVLPIVTALAVANGNTVLVRVLIDSASGVTLARSQITEALGLNNGPYCHVQLHVASGATVKPVKQRRVNFELRSLDKRFSLGIVSALTAQRITGPLDEVNLSVKQKSFLSSHGFNPCLLWKKSDQVDILLDTAISVQLLNQPCISIPDAPTLKLIKTRLGPALAGKLSTSQAFYNQCNIVNMQDLSLSVEKYFALETIGITERDSSLSLEGQNCEKLMASLTTYDAEKREYCTGLLWRRDFRELKGNNFGRAKSTCISGKNKALKSNRSDAVDNAFREKLAAGCAERIPESEIHTTEPHLYLCCHPVYKEAALSTRVRLVYNGSQPVSESGLSINDLLYMGNLQLQRNSDILMRTRVATVLTCLDLKKSYWSVKVRPSDSNFLRYLWIYGRDTKVQHYRHTSLVFGLSPSGYQLQYCMLDLADKFGHLFPLAADNLRKNTFIDDLFLPADSIEDARRLLSETRQLLERGSFVSHKYASNSKMALSEVSPELLSPKDDHKLLGLGWRASADEFYFDPSTILSAQRYPMTRRRVLSLSSMLYDVLGFLQPFTLQSRLIIKQLWEIKSLKWDDEIPLPIQQQFSDWLDDLDNLKEIRIRRHIKGSPNSRKLIIFSDATKLCVCACAYLVTDIESGLLFSKTKTSPLKQTIATDDVAYTIVRMETLACLMAARMKDYIFSVFPEGFFVDHALFLDSLVVLARLKANKPHLYKPWTSSRITEILRRVDASHIFYVEGSRNSADVGCRTASLSALRKNELWFKAPPFVLLSPEHYPKNQKLTRLQAHEQNVLDAKEFKKSTVTDPLSQIDQGMGTYVTTRAQARELARLESAIPSSAADPVSPTNVPGIALSPPAGLACQKAPQNGVAAQNPVKRLQEDPGNWLDRLFIHFSWNKAVRITAYVLRFVQLTLKDGRSKVPLFRLTARLHSFPPFLTVPELRMATLVFIRSAQKKVFAHQLDKLDKPKPRSLLAQYNAFKDQFGLLRSTTRLINSKTLPYSATRPIILPKSEVSNKIILDHHIKNNHAPHSNTAFHLHRWYKIEGGRQTIRKVLHSCPRINCARIIPLQQTLAPLPASRLDPTGDGEGDGEGGGFYAYQNASLDFCGYFLIKHSCQFEECPHPPLERIFVALFTCFLTRAVTLECITDLSTESFLQTFIRFISRRGKPNRLYADNGSQIKRGEREIARLYRSIQWNKVGEAAAERGVEFDYSLPYAQFQNGISERIVGSIKRALRKVLGNAKVTLSCFTTLISEIESQLNSRPLISPSLDKFSETITPALLMLGRNLDSLPLGTMKDADQALPLTRFLAHRKKLMNDFVRRWRRDYVLSLGLSKFSKRPNAPTLKEGMVVLLRDGGLKKEFSLARIEQILPSADSVQRRLLLRTPRGKKLWRHANQISLLECSKEATGNDG